MKETWSTHLVDQLVFYCHQGEMIKNLRSHNAVGLWHELCFSFCLGNNQNSQGLVCLPWCGLRGINRSFNMVLYSGMIKNDLGLITLLGCLLIELLNKSDIFSVLYYEGNIFFKAQSALGTVLQCIHKVFFKFVLYFFFMSLNHIQKKFSQHSQTSVFFLVNWQSKIEGK